jgi:hypothetical protein
LSGILNRLGYIGFRLLVCPTSSSIFWLIIPMLPYLVLLFIISVLGMIAFRSRSRVIVNIIVFCIFLILTLFSGFRSQGVGTDSGTYARWFIDSNSFGSVTQKFPEFGYDLLCLISHCFSDNYFSIFILCSGITVGVWLYCIKNTSCLPELSIFLFIVTGTYTSQFNTIRQAIAVSICFFALQALFEKRLLKYFVCVAIAGIFHITAIIMIPLSFILNRPFTWKNTCFIILFTGIIGLFFNNFIAVGGMVDERFDFYVDDISEARGLYPTLFLVTLVVCFLFFRKIIHQHRKHYDILLNFFLLGTCIAVVSLVNGQSGSGVRRLSMYLTTAELFLWPIIFINMRHVASRLIFLIVFCSCYILYFIVTTRVYSHLVPYSLNPSIMDFIENFSLF